MGPEDNRSASERKRPYNSARGQDVHEGSKRQDAVQGCGQGARVPEGLGGVYSKRGGQVSGRSFSVFAVVIGHCQ